MKKIIDLINTIFKSNIVKILTSTSKIFDKISKKLQKEIEHAARKVRDYAVIILLFFIGLFTLIMGLGFWIENKYAGLSGGKGFMAIGGAALVLAILYYLVVK